MLNSTSALVKMCLAIQTVFYWCGMFFSRSETHCQPWLARSSIAKFLQSRVARFSPKLTSQKVFLLALILLSIIALVNKGSLTGFVTVEKAHELQVLQLFNESTNYSAQFTSTPTSVKISGAVSGNGSAKVYLVSNSQTYLLLNTTQPALLSSFCDKTCSLENAALNSHLVFVLENMSVNLTAIEYTTSEQLNNSPPVWTGNTTIIIPQNTQKVLNLSQLFSDAENDVLTFLVTEAENISSSIEQNILTISPAAEFTGTRFITVIASDNQNIERQLLKVEVAASSVPPPDLAPANDSTQIPVNTTEQVNATPTNATIVNATQTNITNATVQPVNETPVNLVQIDPKVLEEIKQKGKTRAIVKLKAQETQDIEFEKKAIAEQQKALLKNLSKEPKISITGAAVVSSPDIAVDQLYETVPAMSVEITQQGLNALSQNPEVEEIIPDIPLFITRTEAIKIIEADRAHNTTFNNQTIQGQGLSICILDTGTYPHNELASQLVQSPDFVNGDNDANDDHGHGTHVAGIAHATAPLAKLLTPKVCDASGTCFLSTVLAGIDYCVNASKENNIAVISGSFGEGAYNATSCPSYIDSALQTAMGQNISLAFASGNAFSTVGISYPACSPFATSIGASTKSDTVAGFSNRAENLDVLAPGQNVNSTWLNNEYRTLSGTSMATPFVAGSIALVKQSNYSLTPATIEQVLKESGLLIEQWHRINASAALIATGISGVGTLPSGQGNGTGPFGILGNSTACGDLAEDTELSANIQTNVSCFNIEANNLEINCKGFSIVGNASNNASIAINVTRFDSIIISNCTIMNFTYGVYLFNASNSSIIHNNISNTTFGAIILENGSSYNTVFNNTIFPWEGSSGGGGGGATPGYGIVVTNRSIFNNITGNRINISAGSAYGILVVGTGGGITSPVVTVNDTFIANNTIFTISGATGIRIANGAMRTTIQNNYLNSSGMSGSGDMITLTTDINDTVIKNNTLVTSSSSVDGIDSSTRILRLNISDNNISVTSTGIALSSTVVNIIIFNNSISRVSTGISTTTGPVVDINITGNIVNASTGMDLDDFNLSFVHKNTVYASSSGAAAGIKIRVPSTKNNITENQINASGFSSSAGTGIYVDGSSGMGGDMTNLTIVKDNVVFITGSGPSEGGGSTGPAAGILVSARVSGTNVTTNNVSATGDRIHGIVVTDNVNDTVIAFNVVSASGNGSNAIRTFSNVTRINITRNNFTSTVGNASYFLGRTIFAVISDNTFGAGPLDIVIQESNFTILSDQGLKNYSFINASIITFHNSTSGNITFTNESIVASGVSFSDQVAIRHKVAFVNTSLVTQLNMTANITYVNISFIDPGTFKDPYDNGNASRGACPTDICTELTFSSNIYTINVTGWTTYAVNESATGKTNSGECFVPNSSTNYNMTRTLRSNGTCFDIAEGGNISIDCNGFSIIGNNSNLVGFGTNATRSYNLTIQNCNITNFTHSVYFFNASNSSVVHNTMNSTSATILLENSSSNNILFNNTIIQNGITRAYGIFVTNFSNGNNITGNFINTSGTNAYGIYLLVRVNDTIIADNKVYSSADSIRIENRIVRTNITNNFINASGDVRGIYLTNRVNSTWIGGNNVTTVGSSTQGAIELGVSVRSTNITNNTITPKTEITAGIYLVQDINDTIIERNNITIFATSGTANAIRINNRVSSTSIINNTLNTSVATSEGIFLTNDVNDTLISSNVMVTSDGGVSLTPSLGRIEHTNITNNSIRTSGSTGHGIYTEQPTNDTRIISNNITVLDSLVNGIQLAGGSNYTYIQSNKINATGKGIRIAGSSHFTNLSNNTIVHHTDKLDLEILSSNETRITNSVIKEYSFSRAGLTSIVNESLGIITFTNVSMTVSSGINLTEEIVISNNLTRVNTSLRPALNTTANITLFSVPTFSDPIVGRDPEDDTSYSSCPGSVCTEISYADNIFTFNVTGFTSYTINESVLNMNNCGVLNGSFTFNATQTLQSNGSCFDLTGSDVVIECNGFSIVGNNSNLFGYGVNATRVSNVLVHNCNITNFTHGIYFYNVSNSTIANNTFVNDSRGAILLQNSSRFNLIFNNTIISNQSTGSGVIIANFSHTNNITYNRIFTNGTSAHGIHLIQDVNNTIINNNSILTNGTTAAGIRTEIRVWSTNISFNSINSTRFYSIIVTTDVNDTIINSNYLFSRGSTGTAGTGVPIILNVRVAGTNITNNTIITGGGNPRADILVWNGINDTLIHNNSLSSPIGAGIDISTLSSVAVEGTVITNNFFNTSEEAILSSSSPTDILIFNNTFVGNSSGASEAVDIDTTTRTNITGNRMHNYANGVILTQDANYTIIESNTMSNTTSGAIRVQTRSKNTTIRNNYITNVSASSAGIFLTTSGDINDTFIVNNTVITNASSAIGIQTNAVAVRLNITENDVNVTSATAISISSANATVFAYNNITRNNKIEVSVTDSENTVFIDDLFFNYSFTNAHVVTVTNSTAGNVTFTNSSLTVTGSNLSAEVLVFNNTVRVNATLRASLATFANVTLIGTNFTDPRVERDPEDDGSSSACATSICTEISYTQNATFIFNVTSFTSYYANETPSNLITVCPVQINSSTTLTQSISGNGTCIVLNNNSIIFDCNSFTITGDGSGFGFNATSFDNVSVRNCNITNFTHGIFFFNVSNSTVHNNTILNTTSAAVALQNASVLNTIHTNTLLLKASYRSQGIVLANFTRLTNITNNTINVTGNDSIGIALYFNVNDTLIQGNAIVTNNTRTQSILLNNTVARTNISTNSINTTTNLSYGVNAERNVNDTVIHNNSLTIKGYAILLYTRVLRTNITNNKINQSESDVFGITLDSDINDTNIGNNSIITNHSGAYGINEGPSISRLNITNNEINTTSSADAIRLIGSTFTFDLLIMDNRIKVTGGGNGIRLIRNYRVNISKNNITMLDGTGVGGIQVDRSNDTVINYNIINVSNTDTRGIVITQTLRTNITNNNITKTTSGNAGFETLIGWDTYFHTNYINATNAPAILLDRANITNMTNNTIMHNNQFDVQIIASNQSTFRDMDIKNFSMSRAGLTTFENKTFGIITFTNNSMSLNTSNLSSDIIFRSNMTRVNTSNTAAFNTSANITLFGVAMNVPSISRDPQDDGTYAACPGTICQNITFSSSVFFFNVSGFTSYAVNESVNNVNTVSTLSTSGTHNVTSTLQTNSSGFIVTAPDVIINFNGFAMIGNATNAPTKIGVNVTRANNVSVLNANISNFTYAIYFFNATNSTIHHSTFNATSVAIVLDNSSRNNIVFNNTIVTNDTTNAFGIIVMNFSNGNNITFNNINTTGNTARGIYVSSNVNDTTIKDNTIRTLRANAEGIRLDTRVLRTNITNNTITTFGDSSRGIYLATDANSTILENNTLHTNLSFGILLDTRIISTQIIGNYINSSLATGIGVSSTVNDTLIARNVIRTNGTEATGIAIDSNTIFTNITNNNITTFGDSSSAIDIFSGTNNTIIINNTILTNNTGSDGIRLRTRVTITNITNNIINATSATAINISDRSNNSVITGNNITHNRQYEIAVDFSKETAIINEDFFNYSFTSVASLTISNSTTGNITFTNNSMTASGTNLSAEIQVASNRAFVNTSLVRGLNTTANITLTSITFTDPQVLRDPEDDGTYAACPSTICTEISFANNIFTFNVTGFTSHQAGETAEPSFVIIKTDSPASAATGSGLNYTINVTNTGAGNATNVTVTDVYPAGLTFVSSQPTARSGTENTFDLGNITNGTSVLVNITMEVDITATPGTITNNANVTYINSTSGRFVNSTSEDTLITQSGGGGGGGGGGGSGAGGRSRRVQTTEVVNGTNASQRPKLPVFTPITKPKSAPVVEEALPAIVTAPELNEGLLNRLVSGIASQFKDWFAGAKSEKQLKYELEQAEKEKQLLAAQKSWVQGQFETEVEREEKIKESQLSWQERQREVEAKIAELSAQLRKAGEDKQRSWDEQRQRMFNAFKTQQEGIGAGVQETVLNFRKSLEEYQLNLPQKVSAEPDKKSAVVITVLLSLVFVIAVVMLSSQRKITPNINTLINQKSVEMQRTRKERERMLESWRKAMDKVKEKFERDKKSP